MAIVAVAGDPCTTTSVALAAGWPASDDVVLIEADPSGGDLAAWFDLPVAPSLSTVVTQVLDGAWPDVERLTRLADTGIRLVPAPASTAEAAQAVGESARAVAPSLSALRSPTIVADTGRLGPTPMSNPFVAAAGVIVVVHRQAQQSARAAAVRLQRLAEQLESLAAAPADIVVAVVGDAPFGPGEIARFLGDAAGTSAVVPLPDDRLAAAVLAGRTGVSARRLGRLPLMRGARDLATVVQIAAIESSSGLWRSAR